MDLDGKPQAAQRHVEPMVYLDHWALRMFSEDDELAGRLRAALDARKGTLAFSWTNVAEFAKVGDDKSVKRAEELLDSLLPHVFFIDPNPYTVIQRENALMARAQLLPHADQAILSEVMKLKPATVRPITVRGLLNGVSGSVLVASGERLADIFVERVTLLRQQFLDDASFRASVRTATKHGPVPRATRFIVRELIARLLVDPGKKLTRNDAFDWFHTVVPLAYCQAMLLDGHWANQAEIVTKMLADAGSKAQLAAVFSGRGDGVERFLSHLS